MQMTSVEEMKVARERPRSPNLHSKYSVNTKDLPMIEISVPPLMLPLDGLAYKMSTTF